MSQKYQQEIEEILKQVGESPPPGNKKGKPDESLWHLIWMYLRKSLGGRSWRFSAGRVMLVGICLLLAGLLLNKLLPGVGGLIALVSLVLFLAGYGMFFIKPAWVEKRWRGQPIDHASPSWWDRFRRK